MCKQQDISTFNVTTGWEEFGQLNECKPFNCWHKIVVPHGKTWAAGIMGTGGNQDHVIGDDAKVHQRHSNHIYVPKTQQCMNAHFLYVAQTEQLFGKLWAIFTKEELLTQYWGQDWDFYAVRCSRGTIFLFMSKTAGYQKPDLCCQSSGKI